VRLAKRVCTCTFPAQPGRKHERSLWRSPAQRKMEPLQSSDQVSDHGESSSVPREEAGVDGGGRDDADDAHTPSLSERRQSDSNRKSNSRSNGSQASEARSSKGRRHSSRLSLGRYLTRSGSMVSLSGNKEKEKIITTPEKVFGLLSEVLGIARRAPSPRSRNFSDVSSRGRIVKLNVGGQLFSTSLGTLLNGRSTFLQSLLESIADDEADPTPHDEDGNIFVDHDPKNFGLILNVLRQNTASVALPDVGSREWSELRLDVDFFGVTELAEEMDRATEESLEAARVAEELERKEQERKKTRRKSSTTSLIQKQGRELERMRVELHRLQFEKARAAADGRPMFAKMEFAYNVMCVGVTGQGKSSTLNMILDKAACEVSGAQGQGTRGCILKDGVIDNKHFISYLDTQGLGADTSVSDEELLEQIMLSTESIRQMGIINNILISFDLQTRTTPSSIANHLTLCETFNELRRSCFVCFTKWNTNSVISEWNHPLKKWIRAHRRKRSIEAITKEPPSYEEMFRAYIAYLLKTLAGRDDGGALAKMVTFLTYFQSRVIWAYNLDPVEMEDKENDELDPYIEYLYAFYRKRALVTLKRGSTMIKTEDLAFLKDDEDTIARVAARLIDHRDSKIKSLTEIGDNPKQLKALKEAFIEVSERAATNIELQNFDVSDGDTDLILKVLGREDEKAPDVGCAIS